MREFPLLNEDWSSISKTLRIYKIPLRIFYLSYFLLFSSFLFEARGNHSHSREKRWEANSGRVALDALPRRLRDWFRHCGSSKNLFVNRPRHCCCCSYRVTFSRLDDITLSGVILLNRISAYKSSYQNWMPVFGSIGSFWESLLQHDMQCFRKTQCRSYYMQDTIVEKPNPLRFAAGQGAAEADHSQRMGCKRKEKIQATDKPM